MAEEASAAAAAEALAESWRRLSPRAREGVPLRVAAAQRQQAFLARVQRLQEAAGAGGGGERERRRLLREVERRLAAGEDRAALQAAALLLPGPLAQAQGQGQQIHGPALWVEVLQALAAAGGRGDGGERETVWRVLEGQIAQRMAGSRNVRQIYQMVCRKGLKPLAEILRQCGGAPKGSRAVQRVLEASCFNAQYLPEILASCSLPVAGGAAAVGADGAATGNRGAASLFWTGVGALAETPLAPAFFACVLRGVFRQSTRMMEDQLQRTAAAVFDHPKKRIQQAEQTRALFYAQQLQLWFRFYALAAPTTETPAQLAAALVELRPPPPSSWTSTAAKNTASTARQRKSASAVAALAQTVEDLEARLDELVQQLVDGLDDAPGNLRILEHLFRVRFSTAVLPHFDSILVSMLRLGGPASPLPSSSTSPASVGVIADVARCCASALHGFSALREMPAFLTALVRASSWDATRAALEAVVTEPRFRDQLLRCIVQAPQGVRSSLWDIVVDPSALAGDVLAVPLTCPILCMAFERVMDTTLANQLRPKLDHLVLHGIMPRVRNGTAHQHWFETLCRLLELQHAVSLWHSNDVDDTAEADADADADGGGGNGRRTGEGNEASDPAWLPEIAALVYAAAEPTSGAMTAGDAWRLQALFLLAKRMRFAVDPDAGDADDDDRAAEAEAVVVRVLERMFERTGGGDWQVFLQVLCSVPDAWLDVATDTQVDTVAEQLANRAHFVRYTRRLLDNATFFEYPRLPERVLLHVFLRLEQATASDEVEDDDANEDNEAKENGADNSMVLHDLHCLRCLVEHGVRATEDETGSTADIPRRIVRVLRTIARRAWRVDLEDAQSVDIVAAALQTLGLLCSVSGVVLTEQASLEAVCDMFADALRFAAALDAHFSSSAGARSLGERQLARLSRLTQVLNASAAAMWSAHTPPPEHVSMLHNRLRSTCHGVLPLWCVLCLRAVAWSHPTLAFAGLQQPSDLLPAQGERDAVRWWLLCMFVRTQVTGALELCESDLAAGCALETEDSVHRQDQDQDPDPDHDQEQEMEEEGQDDDVEEYDDPESSDEETQVAGDTKGSWRAFHATNHTGRADAFCAMGTAVLSCEPAWAEEASRTVLSTVVSALQSGCTQGGSVQSPYLRAAVSASARMAPAETVARVLELAPRQGYPSLTLAVLRSARLSWADSLHAVRELVVREHNRLACRGIAHLLHRRHVRVAPLWGLCRAVAVSLVRTGARRDPTTVSAFSHLLQEVCNSHAMSFFSDMLHDMVQLLSTAGVPALEDGLFIGLCALFERCSSAEIRQVHARLDERGTATLQRLHDRYLGVKFSGS